MLGTPAPDIEELSIGGCVRGAKWKVAGVLGGVVLFGSGGLLYRRRQIERLRKQRLEMGVDVGTDDDDEPPGLG